MNAVFTKFSTAVANAMGKPITFVLALALVVVWGASGPLFGFSDVWQLVINTSTTIITFLMIFVLQNTQNRDNEALQAKLDELILTSHAHNRFVGIEHLEEKELDALRDMVEKMAAEGNVEAEELSSKIRKHAQQIDAMISQPAE